MFNVSGINWNAHFWYALPIYAPKIQVIKVDLYVGIWESILYCFLTVLKNVLFLNFIILFWWNTTKRCHLNLTVSGLMMLVSFPRLNDSKFIKFHLNFYKMTLFESLNFIFHRLYYSKSFLCKIARTDSLKCPKYMSPDSS